LTRTWNDNSSSSRIGWTRSLSGSGVPRRPAPRRRMRRPVARISGHVPLDHVLNDEEAHHVAPLCACRLYGVCARCHCRSGAATGGTNSPRPAMPSNGARGAFASTFPRGGLCYVTLPGSRARVAVSQPAGRMTNGPSSFIGEPGGSSPSNFAGGTPGSNGGYAGVVAGYDSRRQLCGARTRRAASLYIGVTVT
jgi:hypothetical protein